MNLQPLLIIAASNIVLAAVLGGIAWAVARRSRRPALAHALYLLALIKLVTPPLLDLPVLPDLDSVAVVAALPPIPDWIASTSTALNSNAPASMANRMGISWQEWAGVLWLVGSLVALCFAGYRWWRLDRWIAGMLPASEVVQDEVAQLADRFGLKRPPRAWVVDAPISPMACPSRRGVCLVLPARLLATLSTSERETMLAHELAHIQRRDHWVRCLEIIVISAWWWLPLAWLLRRGLRRSEELCCDAAVLSILPGQEIPYSNLLVATASLLARSHQPPPAHVCGLGPIDKLEERIQMISVHERGIRPGHRGRLLVAVTALAVLPFAACKVPATTNGPGGAPPAAQVGPQQADNRHPDGTGLSAHVVGAVTRPTTIKVVPGLSTALDVLVSSSLTEDADWRNAALIRVNGAETTTLRINYRKMILSGNTSENVLLQAGDIIYFPTKVGASRTGAVLVDKPRIEQGDLVSCVFPPDTQRGKELQLLTKPQAIGPAGTIFVPLIGSMPVVGLTTKEASEALNLALRKFFKDPLGIQVRASHLQSAK